MDRKTAEIRYQQWAQIIQDWSSSGLTKRAYCQEKGIEEKKLYYYQRRIRRILAAQAEQQALPEGNCDPGNACAETGQRSSCPQIVKLRFADTQINQPRMIALSVNGMSLSVPEDISVSFLARLLEAACHDSR